MATRSAVGVIKGRKVKMVYVHNDGYPSHMGAALLGNFKTEEAVEEIFESGVMLSYIDDLTGSIRVNHNGNPLSEFEIAEPNVIIEAELDEGHNWDYAYMYVYKEGDWYLIVDGMPVHLSIIMEGGNE